MDIPYILLWASMHSWIYHTIWKNGMFVCLPVTRCGVTDLAAWCRQAQGEGPHSRAAPNNCPVEPQIGPGLLQQQPGEPVC